MNGDVALSWTLVFDVGARGGLGLPFSQSLVGGSDVVSAWVEGKKNPNLSFYRENFHRITLLGWFLSGKSFALANGFLCLCFADEECE